MPSSNVGLLIGDIGGTNARLQLWSIYPSLHNVFRSTYRTFDYNSLGEIIKRFIVDSSTCLKISKAVLAVCGPIYNKRRSNDPNNVVMRDGSRWLHQHADQVEIESGMERGSLLFLNDFEAIGYSVAALHDQKSSASCKPENIIVLHSGEVKYSAPCACLGAGTGLGACYLVPRLDTQQYAVYPSEAGMTQTFCPKSDDEWALLKYIRENSNDPFLEIERFVSGPAFVEFIDFFSKHKNIQLLPTLDHELKNASKDEGPAIIAQHAQRGDELCLMVVDLFLDIFGRTLGTAAQTFLPYSGLYIVGGILPKLAWRLKDRNLIVKSYLDQGDKMSETVARIPLLLIDDDDLGLKGCLYAVSTSGILLSQD
ncbi:unnamed protein product [Didymodactylos carnosus]|uniref:Glucokinase n=1 Tax=Didymodactylos carnosus TaxID=1234261 RepID=A0A814GJ91_9BILA|nr:unnamed protein product [Didymodactylos carnosus]CAF1424960.1 unnamed protein product [Didymodactylos carnosus]CAF3768675.1 unnamed protein product [Didymodactylos carnosus]CAF4224496.1 unnamed protein product [Didymodactylos carnosus]